MKINMIFLVYFQFVFAGLSFAQKTRLKYFGIEAGTTIIDSKISNVDHIRGSIPAYTNGYSTSNLASFSNKTFIGVKGEIFSLNDRFALLAGLRLSRINSSVGRNTQWSDNSNYFYWLYKEDSTNTEYLKVKEINQKSDYLGIPVEVIFFPINRPHLFRIYVKLGTEFNYLIQTKKDVVFYDAAMNPYKGDLVTRIDEPKTFYSALYGGGGVRFGRDKKPSLSIEACVAYLFITSQSSGLLNPTYGGGVQVNFQMPIK